MKYRLINILMCPECRYFPLKIYVKSETKVKKGYDIKKAKSMAFECDVFCGFKNELIKNIEKNKKYAGICTECLKININSGYLVCSKCKTKYPIINSIPRMIPRKFSNI